MKKRFLSLILTISIMLSALAGISVSAAETEVIGGASADVATEVSLNIEYAVAVDENFDADYFTFTTGNEGFYEIISVANNNVFAIQILSAREKELAEGTFYDEEDVLSEKLEANERYLIKISKVGPYSKTEEGIYFFEINYKEDSVADNIENAKEMFLDQKFDTELEGTDDIDWFMYTNDSGMSKTVTVSFANNTGSGKWYFFCNESEDKIDIVGYNNYELPKGYTREVDITLEPNQQLFVKIWFEHDNRYEIGENGYYILITDKQCEHKKTSKNNYVTEYEEIRGDENNHYIIKYYDEICDECGATIEEKVQDSKYSERHDFSGDYCSDCGFEKEAESLPIVQEPTDTPSDYEDKETEEKYYMAYSFEARNLDNLLTPKEGKANINREQWTGDTFEFTAVTSQDVDEISICGDKPDDTYWHEIPYSYLRENYLLGYVDNDDGTRTWTCQFSIHEIGYRAFMLKINGYETGFITYLTLHENKGSFSPTPQQGEISVLIDGKGYVNFDVPPQIINGRTMLPVRAVAEALGGYADWDEDTKTASIACYAKDNVEKSCDIIIGSTSMYWEEVGGWIYGGTGGYKELDSPAVIIDGRTLVPFRAIAEVFGYDVEWNDSTRTVTIK